MADDALQLVGVGGEALFDGVEVVVVFVVSGTRLISLLSVGGEMVDEVFCRERDVEMVQCVGCLDSQSAMVFVYI